MHRRAKKRARRALPADAAKTAGLRYVSDASPGIRRRRSGKGFSYLDAEGRTIRDRAVLRRIRDIVIPPAWTDVWICGLENGHIQASARDAKGRKQYRYHARWREVRDEDKYGRMIAFGEGLPKLRRRIEEDLGRPGLPREKLLATVVRLLELTLIRVGNEEYARANESYGLTTMRDHHVRVEGTKLKFRFKGKSGKVHEVEVADRRVAAVVKRCRALPGQELFQYVDEAGEAQSIGSSDVNAYLREAMGEDFTAKDFRTWAGSVLAAHLLRTGDAGVVETIKAVARQLGNTPATCRKHYVHPLVIAAFEGGTLGRGEPGDDLAAREAALLKVLRAGA